MNDQVQFLSGTEALIIEAMSISLGEDVRNGQYICVPVISESFQKLRYLIDDGIDGVVVLKNRVIIETKNEMMTLSFLMRNGKVVSWTKILEPHDVVQLSLLLNFGVLGQEVYRYE